VTVSLDRARAARVFAVIRARDGAGALNAVESIVRGGLTGIEITYTTPGAGDALAAAADRYGDAIVLGAGTIRTPAQAREAVAAGAEFLVSPGLDDGLVSAMRATGAVTMAGALTPTEVMRAEALGVDLVKVFPASLGGPSYLRSLRGPFPDTPFMPTGGVAVANLEEWFGAGAVAVGAGSELCSADDIAAGRFDDIEARAREYAEALA